MPRDAAPDLPSAGDARLATVAYVAAVFFPPLGFAVGIVLVARGRTRTGYRAVALSLVVSFVFLLAFGVIGGGFETESGNLDAAPK